MKRILIIILLICALAEIATAQRVTHNFQNMSMSDALKLVQRQTDKYKIVFIYDDLEDFKVTTSVKGKSVPDAVQQMIGFYPISMTVNDDNEIYVECIHKTDHRLKGLVVDENNLPLPYANVTLLNPADSTMLGGGVTNESGYFAIPYEHARILARITYVGYKPAYRLCSRDNAGTIKMQPDQFTLDGVTVKGERPQYKMTTGGMTVNVAGTVLSDMGTGIDVLSQLPRVDVKGDGQVSVFGSGTPLIYINNRPIQSNTELSRLKSSDIKSIDVITSPGA